MGRRTSNTGGSTDEHYHYSGDKVAYVTNASGSISKIFTYDGTGRFISQDTYGTGRGGYARQVVRCHASDLDGLID